ncbi:protein UGX2 [Kluyveromyces marxianus]|uniref:Protein UGX2 n=1 Tax=Kluyveromyces marxianus TaxID=4911 RepID=A0ABX6EWF4_KLUMA|nr:protein UGX2 [Kluyveromyces marxianus]BAP72422.1 protein UGX2 [Kluyveromyces marxianus]
MRELYLSSSMLASETGIAYEVSDSYSSRRHGSEDNGKIQYVISMAHSQGFDWNQDFFATRYEQMCQVVYDGHVDSVESVIEELKSRGCLDEEESSSDADGGMSESPVDVLSIQKYRRISDAFIRPRRKSDRSISFSADREQGNFKRAEVIVIDVESDTPENRVLKSLVKS